MVDQLPTPAIFAHRGAVIHDQTLERTTDGVGKVADYSLAALKELDAGGKYDISYKGEQIPTLDEVFEAVGKKTFINVELKNYGSPCDNLPEKVANIVLHHNLEDWILFSSFNPIALIKIRKFLPRVPLGLLAIPGFGGAWARSFLGRSLKYQALHPDVKDTKIELVQRCHRYGHRVYTYTVNYPEVISRLFKMGVDGICTDDPPLAIRVKNSITYEIDREQNINKFSKP
jgi:glycerophosphoryl diester phosphodiesterase